MSGALDTLRRVSAAQAWVHRAVCPDSEIPHFASVCVAGVTLAEIAAGLDALDAAPRDAHAARVAMHDQGGCSRLALTEPDDGPLSCHERGGHADARWTDKVALLRKFRADEARL